MATGERLVLVLWFILCVGTRTYGESSTCLTVYEEGGAPAVFQSPKCPRWKLPSYGSKPRYQSPAANCQTALHQGRRKQQEDRAICALDIRVPFLGPKGITEVTVGIVGVFDGHNGAEASEMASKLLLEYFTVHMFFLLDTTFSVLLRKLRGWLPNERGNDVLQDLKWDEELGQHQLKFGRLKLSLSSIFDESFPLEIFKEAVLRAIDDIDSAFSRDAFRNNFDSGSTAAIILMAENQIFAANIGDSKAFVCSEDYKSSTEARAALLRMYRQTKVDGIFHPFRNYRTFESVASDGLSFLIARELTRDHHPDRDDERSRVESAGGHVSEWGGVARVNGQLAVSRAIGDVYLKSYGVISVPEITDWQPLTENDSYLVAASDGVLEQLNPQDVCDILSKLRADFAVRSELNSSCMHSLADCIVNAAFKKGSTDNMAAIILPFRSKVPMKTLPKEDCDGLHISDCPALGYNGYSIGLSELAEMEQAHPVVTYLDRLLVVGKDRCFYLSENLDEKDDNTFWIQKDVREYPYELGHGLSVAGYSSGGPVNLYNDQHLCLNFGMNFEGNKEQCINPEGFARFLGLLESVPFNDTFSNEHATADSRYILKKRYDRGSYGEVWMAFPWNCSHGNKTSENAKTPYSEDSDNDHSDDTKFILKRIMVEKGVAVYLSGLREKHFGELFLNATTVLGGPLSARESYCLSKDTCLEPHGHLMENDSIGLEMGEVLNFDNIYGGRSEMMQSTYEEGLNHIARYIESFESQSNEIWLVFRHEGVSLSKILYTAEEVTNSAGERNEQVKNVQILHPSKWWYWLKTTEAGREEMRNLIWQLLMALKSCHDRNITHRDIKPENMVICFEDMDSGRCLKGHPSGDNNYTTKMRIIDFGSALDDFTLKHLYGSVGPSRAEQTCEYTPPEAFLNASWYQGPTSASLKYDMWSVGVVMLELILGSPNVFQISSRTRALLDQHLEGWNDSIKELAFKLRAFMELCILIPGSSTKPRYPDSVSPAPWKCSEEFFLHQIRNRDPLKIGFPNIWALRLVRQLLHWNPEDRLSVDEALKHPYFSQHANNQTDGKV
ncbi:uncharacterized protein LOC116016509 isoform X3 [Ipomoea triloba]|uniref:uncharacterized protein LOC116016509 isoform X3 n=1 Tax=Ipomoea triloba TaxID=35885 RepID=UPI00125D5665|nr:uncharacterized protein LOC116016509 isoform X3 [Ipomoea triloba]